MSWDGDSYQARFDALAEQGESMHGEALFVVGLAPRSVLDAGCGTGRVAIEIARQGARAAHQSGGCGVSVAGVDNDASMLATARRRQPEMTWVEADLTTMELDRRFDVVVMAGNVPLFTPAGTQEALVAGCARHLAEGGSLVCGFQLDRGYGLSEYDGHCARAGLELAERWATWDREPFSGNGSYAVSVHH